MDWVILRAIAEVAAQGSLSAAAKALGQSQPTLSRHIRTAEEHFGQPLFTRHARGLRPTPFCESLLPAAEKMRHAAAEISVLAAGQIPDAHGRVRLTASVFVANHVLPPILAALRESHPGIAVDLVSSNATDNLLFHEADIALRMYRPTQLDMITRHVGDLELGLFAADSYVARRGLPESAEDLGRHDLVGYDRDETMLRAMRAMGFDVERDWFIACTDDQAAYWALVREGCGIGACQVGVASRTPGVIRVLPDLPLPRLQVWLTSHPALRHQPRVATVWSALERGLAPLVS